MVANVVLGAVGLSGASAAGVWAAAGGPDLPYTEFGLAGLVIALFALGRVVPDKSRQEERRDRRASEQRERDLLKNEADRLYVAIDKAAATSHAFDAAAANLVVMGDKMDRLGDRLERTALALEAEWERQRREPR